MKRLFLIGITLLLIFCLSATAFAAELPSVGGALAPEDDTSSLTDEEYQLRKTAYEEILVLSQDDENITGVKISSDSKWVFVAIVIDENEDPQKFKEYAKKFISQYGDFILFVGDIDSISEDFSSGMEMDGGDTGGILSKGLGNSGGNQNPSNNLWLWLSGGAVLVITLSASLFWSIRRVSAMQTSNGKIIVQGTSISTKTVISAVKNSEDSPDSKVFTSILQSIED